MTRFTRKLTAAAVAVVCVALGGAGVTGFAPPAPALPPALPAAAPVPPKKKDPNERTANAAQRQRSRNNLKQIILALHVYHDAIGHFPQNVTDKNGNPLLSWRVQILPYIEQQNLYLQFKLDEPWDSENNKKLLAQMPDIFRVGFEPKDATKTYYQGFAGPGTLFEPGKKVKITHILDGTSNTLAVVEAGPPVEWTKPADIWYLPKKPLPKLEGPFSNVLAAATADGAAHLFGRDIDEKTMRRLIEVADGEPVDVEALHGKFPLTAEDMEAAKKLLASNEELMKAIAAQLNEQQKLVLELAKQGGKGAAGLDFEQLTRMNADLERGLEELKRRTEALKQQLDEAKRGPAKPEK